MQQNNINRMSAYIDLIAKLLKTFLSPVYGDQTSQIMICTDFVHKLLSEPKHKKFASKLAHLLKQIAFDYQRSHQL
jgi:hypothetical protein